jgi:hypothetical protein
MSGIVTDKQSRHPVERAFIVILTRGVEEGSSIRIRVEKSGYEPCDEWVPVSPTIPLQISLIRAVPSSAGHADGMQQWIQQLGQGTPNERLAGVTGVSAFMGSSHPDQRSEAELALSNAIAIETSETVRLAIVSSFENLDPKMVSQPELERVASLLVQKSRGLVLEGNLWFNRSSHYYSLDVPHDSSAEARAKDVADSIAACCAKELSLATCQVSIL